MADAQWIQYAERYRMMKPASRREYGTRSLRSSRQRLTKPLKRHPPRIGSQDLYLSAV